MATKKLFTDSEKKYGVIFNGKLSDLDKLTDDEALELLKKGEHTGVNFEDRIKFLEDNGYEVTRENLIADLSARPQEEEA